MYDLAAAAGMAVHRSLAEQVEYWVRLGAALDAAGITMEESLLLLQGDRGVLDRMLAHVTSPPGKTRRRKRYTGDPSIAARNAQLEREVERGERSPESLFLFTREQVKSAKITQRQPDKPGKGW
ncbi:hypothetical protein ASC88_09120 [Rhizobacter sp. Root29]|nr:hypothetical protein ASC88_09120 [Rhizobacter sp. Root29]